MSSPIDLGTSSGFALATQGAASSALTLLGYDPSEWDLAEGSYNGILFHVFAIKSAFEVVTTGGIAALTKAKRVDWSGAVSRVTDSGGRRKAKFMFPYQDGQVLDDLGRTPETFSFEILLYGKNYKKGLNALFKELQKPEPGNLIHPVRGEIRCAMESYEITHQSESRNAVAIRLTMCESNLGDMTYATIKEASTFNAALAGAATFINVINRVINKVQAALMFVSAVRQTVTTLTETYRDEYTATLSAINKVFNENTTSDISNILPQNTQTTAVFPGSLSPNDPFANIDTENLSKETASAVASKTLETALDSLRQETSLLIKTIATMKVGSLSIDPTLASLIGRQPNGTLINADQSTIASDTADVFSTSPGALANIPDGDGSLEFADEIKDLRDAALAIQTALDVGLQANKVRIVEYTTPRLMSVRELMFALGVNLEKVSDIDALNPELESLNYIPKGTTVMVAV